MTIAEALADLDPAIARLTLRRLLDSLPSAPDTPEEHALQEQEAIAALAALLYPANALETRLAIRAIAADSHAMACLNIAVAPASGEATARSMRTLASTMMRQSAAALSTLRREQAARQKLEDARGPRAMQRAGYRFKDISIAPPETAAEPASPPPEPEDRFRQMTEAEQYAALYPDRAARIRACVGLPSPWNCDVPTPRLLNDIVHSTSSLLRELEGPGAPLLASPLRA